MQEIFDLFTISNTDFFLLFGKAFAVLFSFLYLVYAVVLVRQTQIMNRTYKTHNSTMLLVVTATQIIFALVLIFVSIVLI